MSQLTLAKAKEILPKYTTEDHLFTHAMAVSALWRIISMPIRTTGKLSAIFMMWIMKNIPMNTVTMSGNFWNRKA